MSWLNVNVYAAPAAICHGRCSNRFMLISVLKEAARTESTRYDRAAGPCRCLARAHSARFNVLNYMLCKTNVVGRC